MTSPAERRPGVPPGAAPAANAPLGRAPTPSHPLPVVPQADAAGGGESYEGDPVVHLVRRALETPRLTITRMSEELGIPRGTLEAYRLGVRRMPSPARRRLAESLQQHADGVRGVADALLGIDGVR
jgi:hypothetical protein